MMRRISLNNRSSSSRMPSLKRAAATGNSQASTCFGVTDRNRQYRRKYR
jgi:hypothetical protein